MPWPVPPSNSEVEFYVRHRSAHSGNWGALCPCLLQPQRGWPENAIRRPPRPSGGAQVFTSSTGLAGWLALASLILGRGLGNITVVRLTCDAAGRCETA